MKRSVDLTENRVFTTGSTPFNNDRIAEMLMRLIKAETRFPWSKILKGFSNLSDYSYRALILTGNKKDIERKKDGQKYDNGDTCERCGFDFTKLPWNKRTFNYGLCRSCYIDMNEDWVFGKRNNQTQRRSVDVLVW